MYDRSFAYNEGSKLCGKGYEMREIVDLTLQHNGNSATVVFTSNLDEDAENVFNRQSLIRNHGESEISKFSLSDAQLLAILVLVVMPPSARIGG